jgi:NAD dependent epimerase/dehydratase family enzyme
MRQKEGEPSEPSFLRRAPAPHPLPNADFLRALREAWGARIALPSPRWLIEMGAWLMRTESELVLKSRRVAPARLLAAGFQFQFPEWPAAARDLVARRRATGCTSA